MTGLISDLPAASAFLADSILEVTSDPAGTPASEKATGAQIRDFLAGNGTLLSAMTDTWNNAGTAFVGLGLDITDTSSAAGSLAMRIRGGAAGTTTLMSLSKAGELTLAAGVNVAGRGVLSTNGVLYLLGTGETAAGSSSYIIGRNSTSLTFGVGGNNRWQITTSTYDFSPAVDNSYDFGAAARRIRRQFMAEYMDISEMTAPSAPGANTARLFVQDNGAGKTQLMAIFPSGAAQQVAIEP